MFSLEVIQLPVCDDLDTEEGIKRVGGSAKLYARLLMDFASSNIDMSAQIEQALAIGNTKRVMLIAHSIKGAAASLAADPLVEVAGRFEDALREKNIEQLPKLMQSFDAHLLRLCRSIQEHFSNLKQECHVDGADVEAVANSLTALSVLQRLIKRLAEGDAEAEDLIPELVSAFHGLGWSKEVSEIVRLIEDVEYNAALVVADQLIEQLGESA